LGRTLGPTKVTHPHQVPSPCLTMAGAQHQDPKLGSLTKFLNSGGGFVVQPCLARGARTTHPKTLTRHAPKPPNPPFPQPWHVCWWGAWVCFDGVVWWGVARHSLYDLVWLSNTPSHPSHNTSMVWAHHVSASTQTRPSWEGSHAPQPHQASQAATP